MKQECQFDKLKESFIVDTKGELKVEILKVMKDLKGVVRRKKKYSKFFIFNTAYGDI